MILDLSTINFVGGGGESSAPAGKVETVEVNITMNGTENPTLNEGFTAFGEVTVNSDNVENSSALLFTQIGFSEELNTELNAQYNADIAYSKELLDKWINGQISNFNYDKKLVFCPKIDTSNVTDLYNFFKGCNNLQFIPQLNTSNASDMMSSMFSGCESLETIPMFNTSNIMNMSQTFLGCYKLKTIPSLDTSKVTKMTQTFYACTSLESLPLLNFQNVVNIDLFFGFSTITTLTDLGGFKDLKIDWNGYGLSNCPNLTYQSVMNVLNNLYDFRANGDDTTTRTIKLHSNSYNLLTADDIAIVNGKGWNIQS